MDQYYAQIEQQLRANKDSIFEPCEIRNFDTKTMTAEVFFVRSKQTRKNTIVLFPAFFQDSGIFSVPLDGTKALAFWGADNQAFVFPVQFNLPSVTVENGLTILDATTQVSDSSTSLEFLTPGEYYIKSPAGSYVYMDALKDIEIGTESFRFLRLTNDEGVLEGGIEGYSFNGDYFEETNTTVDVDGESGQVYRFVLKQGDILADEATVGNTSYVIGQLMQEDNEAAIDGIEFTDAEQSIVIEAGMVFDEVQGDKVRRKLTDSENVVYSLGVQHGKIELGENGTMKLSGENAIIDIEKATIHHGTKTYTLAGLIDRLELISTLLEIPDPLNEVGE